MAAQASEQPQDQSQMTTERPVRRRTLSVGTKTGDEGEGERSPRLTTPKRKWMELWSRQHAKESEAVAAEATGEPAARTSVAEEQKPVMETETRGREDGEVESDAEPGEVADRRLQPQPQPQPQPQSDAQPDPQLPPQQELQPQPQPQSDPQSEPQQEPQSEQQPQAAVEPQEVATDLIARPPTQLHVKMPPTVEASSLSPSAGGRPSPTPGPSSISPSAKLKDVSADGAAVVRSRTPSPAKAPTEASTKPSSSEFSSTTSSTSVATDTESTGPPDFKRKASDDGSDEAMPPPDLELTPEELEQLTESERHRLERRKKRKTNWDVGDPRKHGGSLDLAALNLLSSTNTPATHPASFAKFPRQRPAYRHSHSMDGKDPHPPPFYRRASFGGFGSFAHSSPSFSASSSTPTSAPGMSHSSPPLSSLPPSAPRRAFHHSSSLSLERSRANPRPSASRYPPANGAYR